MQVHAFHSQPCARAHCSRGGHPQPRPRTSGLQGFEFRAIRATQPPRVGHGVGAVAVAESTPRSRARAPPRTSVSESESAFIYVWALAVCPCVVCARVIILQIRPMGEPRRPELVRNRQPRRPLVHHPMDAGLAAPSVIFFTAVPASREARKRVICEDDHVRVRLNVRPQLVRSTPAVALAVVGKHLKPGDWRCYDRVQEASINVRRAVRHT